MIPSTNLSILTQQILKHKLPDPFSIKTMQVVSTRPYKFLITVSNGVQSRVVNADCLTDSEFPVLKVTNINRKPVSNEESFDLLKNVEKVFNEERIMPPTLQTTPEVVMRENTYGNLIRQVEGVTSRVKLVLNSNYSGVSRIEMTQNDGITAQGYFNYKEGYATKVLSFQYSDMNGTLKVFDHSTHEMVNEIKRGKLKLASKKSLEEQTNDESISEAKREKSKPGRKKTEDRDVSEVI